MRVKKLFQTYAVFELGDLSELKVAAELLAKRPEVLATEWLQRKRLFGIQADLDEMAKFKSKIKREDIAKKDEKKAEGAAESEGSDKKEE